jgi:hypothetical protein
MEPQLHYLKERRNALISMKRYGCLGDFFAILTAGLFLVDIAITLIQSIPHGLSYMPPSLTTSFFGREVGGFVVSLLMFELAWMTLSVLAKSLNLTGWEPITAVPMWYLVCCGVVITVMLLSLQSSEWSSLGRTFMTAFLIALLTSRRNACKAERKHAQAALAIKAQEKQSPQLVKRQMKKCEVCQQESLYDLCLTCESKYKGERQRVRAQILRAKRAGVPATLTLPQWLETVNTFHNHCAYCNGPYELMEHYIPVSEGGGTIQDNCVPGCFSCNAKKSNKHPEM